ncbi:MAG TPA: methyltransferase domain-containing protein [Catalimonadaceae bacterium]|nr:methyltransferase domain-containing protein [Catalimonadaceae bacterium]HPI11694.1 methyltransferase domain-containing protein [Catalimonadaceae bacterium]
MPFFSKRNTKSELMDDFDMPQEELDINLLELEIINRWLGGYSVSFSGLSNLNLPKDREIIVVDIGCGGGDGMISMQQFLHKRGIKAKMIGVDANPKVLDYARKRCKNHPDFQWECEPFQNLASLNADVFHCSLFAHHFYGEDLSSLASLMASARIGFVVNDLHRHWLAYHSISILTRLFSKSYLVRNDARLSVSKSFSRDELLQLFSFPQSHAVSVRWQWAFRWLVSGHKRTKS